MASKQKWAEGALGKELVNGMVIVHGKRGRKKQERKSREKRKQVRK